MPRFLDMHLVPPDQVTPEILAALHQQTLLTLLHGRSGGLRGGLARQTGGASERTKGR